MPPKQWSITETEEGVSEKHCIFIEKELHHRKGEYHKKTGVCTIKKKKMSKQQSILRTFE